MKHRAKVVIDTTYVSALETNIAATIARKQRELAEQAEAEAKAAAERKQKRAQARAQRDAERAAIEAEQAEKVLPMQKRNRA